MNEGFLPLILSVVAFVVSHMLTKQSFVRRGLEALLGRAGFIVAYSALSLLLLGWMIICVTEAPVILVWEQLPWMRQVPPAVMPVVAILAVAGLSSPNPFSVGRGAGGYDPTHPGILRLTRHPVLWAAFLWAASHAISNGDIAGLIFFVPMMVFAMAGIPLLDLRMRNRFSGEEWQNMTALTHHPKAWREALAEIGGLRISGGFILYLLLMLLHPLVIGRMPLSF